MMMQMLEAGGIPILTDEERQADADNPKGYYEYEPVKTMAADATWLETAQGKALKVIHAHLSNLPVDRAYKVIFMRRNLEAVLDSQRVMLDRSGKAGSALEKERLNGVFARQLRSVEASMAASDHIDVLYLDFDDVVGAPRQAAERARDFLGRDLDLDRMVGAVDQTLRHHHE